MQHKKDINYWLFQIKPSVFQIEKALQANEFKTYPVNSRRYKIQKGDKIIVWKTGKNAGCYALATATSKIGNWPYSKTGLAFFKSNDDKEPNVKLKIDLNFWNNPLEGRIYLKDKIFNRFKKELPGINYKVTQKHYSVIEEIARKQLPLESAQKNFEPFQKSDHLPLNLILFGPPGTGKTYTAISLAVAIIENKSLEKVSRIERSKLRARFDEYLSEGQIGFVTFHPSYTYEDFVEGVKPHTENNTITYKIEEGIFKQIAFEAKRNMLETLMANKPQSEIVISFNQLYKAFVQYVKSDQFKSFETKDKERAYLHKMERNGDFILRKENTYTTDLVTKKELRLAFENIPNADQNGKVLIALQSILKASDLNVFFGVFMELKKFETKYTNALEMLKQRGQASDNTVESFDFGALANQIKDQTKKYILIIDEINRGEVSEIFGELITLIEEDKREGNSEGLIVQLPYSKSHFCVPSNLYIIGTMNTADQSVEELDIALRRRFDFLEMEPNASVIKRVNKTQKIEGIDMIKMLNAINERIEVLLGRDFRIGHTYFLNVSSLAEIKEVFIYKIIPLLQSYLNGDFLRLGLILGKDFVQKGKIKNENIFADFDMSVFETEAIETYKLKPISKLPKEAFIRIYDTDFEV